MKKVVYILMGGFLTITILFGCKRQERKQVEEQLSDFTSLYPMEDLTKFYDLEGYRDEDFAEDDKGTWSLSSGYSLKKDEKLHDYSIMLFFNRNTRTAEGYYYYSIFGDSSSEEEVEKIPIEYKKGKLSAKNSEKLPYEIENYQFLIQYVNLDEKNLGLLDLRDSKNDEQAAIYYNSYYFDKESENLEQIIKNYKIQDSVEQVLALEGSGKNGKEFHSYRRLEIDFDNSESFRLSERIAFKPSNLSEDD